jgi:protein phosphatase
LNVFKNLFRLFSHTATPTDGANEETAPPQLNGPQLEFHVGSLSIKGNFRENNEDRFFVDPNHRYVIVADGMGGQCSGEKASEMAVDIVRDYLDKHVDFARPGLSDAEVSAVMDQAATEANMAIMERGANDPQCLNMGTTLVLLVRVGNAVLVGGSGDSRAYRLRDGHLEQLTDDHTIPQYLLKAGIISAQEAANHRFKNNLYKYLGTKEGNGGLEAKTLALKPGDRFMLCSDGCIEGVTSEQIATLLASELPPGEIAEKMVAQAEAAGSKDNITCLVLAVAAR